MRNMSAYKQVGGHWGDSATEIEEEKGIDFFITKLISEANVLGTLKHLNQEKMRNNCTLTRR